MKKVKILAIKPGMTGFDCQPLEDKINNFLDENNGKIEIIDIKYVGAPAILSALIYYIQK